MFMPNKSMMTMNGLEKMKMMSLNPMMMTTQPQAVYTGRIGKSLPMKLNTVGSKSNTNDEVLNVGSKLESQ